MGALVCGFMLSILKLVALLLFATDTLEVVIGVGVESPTKSNKSLLLLLLVTAGLGLDLFGLIGYGFTFCVLAAGFYNFLAICEKGFLVTYYCYPIPVILGTINGLFIDGVFYGFLSLSVLYLSRVDLPLV